MAHSTTPWFSGNQRMSTPLTKKRLIAEINRIANEKWPVAEKMREARSLVDQYSKSYSSRDMLDTNV